MTEEEIQNEEEFVSPGRIRTSQLITTFGPGAILSLQNDSVIVKGIDFWFHRKEFVKKNHIFLSRITKKSHFRIPHVKKSKSLVIAVRTFPQWGFCSKSDCGRLQRHLEIPDKTGKNKFNEEKEGKFYCVDHSWAQLYPARLVMVCKQGHLSEFPWSKWAHGDKDNPVVECENPVLRWRGGKSSTSLNDYFVECSTCGARRNMFGSTSSDGVKIYHPGETEPEICKCKGEMPWLDSTEKCKKIDGSDEPEIPEGMLARATSMYYSKVIRGLIIPKLAHEIAQYLQSDEYETINSIPMFNQAPKEVKAAQILQSKTDWQLKNYTEKEILEFMNLVEYREGEENSIKSELDIKEIEYQDLLKNQKYISENLDTELEMEDIPLTSDDKKYLQAARKLKLLTILEVLPYFTRLIPPSGSGFETEEDKNRCRIEVAGTTNGGRKYKKNDWLPANKKVGEGIFFVLNNDFIEKFTNSKINSRLEQLIKNRIHYESNTSWSPDTHVDQKYVILHSLAHILIKKLGPDSGFDLASISERIYSSKNMNGILIYTSSTGEGSLGGLIKQIDNVSISNLIMESIKEIEHCSRDPICINEDPADMNSRPLNLRLNGSACFACLMLPETSCEYFNKMLDRKIWTDKEFGILKQME